MIPVQADPQLGEFRRQINDLAHSPHPSGSTIAIIAKRYGATLANLSNWIREHGIIRPRS